MKTLEDYIENKQQEFVNHNFFKLLKELKSLEEISYFIPELTFWAMTFQDILRINEDKVQTPYLKKIARHHRLEDAGHEKWFLYDKKYIGNKIDNKYCNKDSITWLYSKDSQLIRDAAYAIMSEIYKATDERVNIALLLTLESSGHIFFEKVVNQVKKSGEDKNLKYFSSSHLEVEMAHALFEEEMEKKMHEMKITMEVRRESLKMIDRCYDAFNKMFDGLTKICKTRIKASKKAAKNDKDYTIANAG